VPLGSRRTLGICTVILAQLDCPWHSLLQLFSTNTALISDYLLPMPLQSLRSGELIAPLLVCLRRDHAWGTTTPGQWHMMQNRPPSPWAISTPRLPPPSWPSRNHASADTRMRYELVRASVPLPLLPYISAREKCLISSVDPGSKFFHDTDSACNDLQ
jgi:hypothetical protein